MQSIHLHLPFIKFDSNGIEKKTVTVAPGTQNTCIL